MWNNQTPISTHFDDVYFSVENGLEESRYVFIKQNDLPERWQSKAQSTFVIFETGFGTGLNFLATWAEWLKTPDQNCPIHFVSIEKHPLDKQALAKSHKHWPKLKALSDQLLEQYPFLIKGQHQLIFEEGKVTLTLIFGDVNEDLEDYSFSVDAWFLDGFAPSKNPDMWSEKLYQFMAKRSHNQATLATFTAAGSVRRALEQKGFRITKIPGYGKKREMIKGVIDKDFAQFFSAKAPCWCYPKSTHLVSSRPNHSDYDAAVVGGGLAGITTALCLANKGLKVVLIEQEDQLCAGASGQSQLAQYAKFPVINNKEYRFILHCLLFSQRYFSNLQIKHSETEFWHKTGLLQLAWNDREKERIHKLLKHHQLPLALVKEASAQEATELSGIDIDSPALWFQENGWLDPKAFSEFAQRHPLISTKLSTKVTNLCRDEQNNQWLLQGDTETIRSTYTVIATANAVKESTLFSHLPIKPLRGQVSTINDKSLPETKCILCGEGYLCPPVDHNHHFGATYDLNSDNSETTEKDNLKNIHTINKWLPNWLNKKNKIELSEITGKAGLRCTTTDYMPIVGFVPIEEDFSADFPKLRHNANAHPKQNGSYYKNLFINVGHGSKGLVSTPACGELIGALMTTSPLPFDYEMMSSLSPSRFLIRDLTQRKR